MSFLGSFEHTTGKTWGGTQVSPGLLKTAALLGGFVGADHLLLRSPKTALVKFLVNIFTLGLWYWYDIIQVFSDLDFVKTYGYTIPLLGPVGLGAGILNSPNAPPADKEAPTPFMFLAYILLIFLPFGVSNFIAGDFKGGAVKFFMTFFFLTTIFALLGTLYSAFRGIFQTETVLTRGVDRAFPSSLLLGSTGPAPNLIPPGLLQAEEAAKEASEGSGISGFLTGLLKPLEEPILKTAVAVGEPTVDAAQAVKDLSKLPILAGGGNTALTNTAMMLSTQQGGAPDSNVKYMFLAASLFILLGSVGITSLRFWMAKKNDPTNHSERNDFPPDLQNDVPPGPGVL